MIAKMSERGCAGVERSTVHYRTPKDVIIAGAKGKNYLGKVLSVNEKGASYFHPIDTHSITKLVSYMKSTLEGKESFAK